MTKIYFVRHAQPQHAWEEDRTVLKVKNNSHKFMLNYCGFPVDEVQ